MYYYFTYSSYNGYLNQFNSDDTNINNVSINKETFFCKLNDELVAVLYLEVKEPDKLFENNKFVNVKIQILNKDFCDLICHNIIDLAKSWALSKRILYLSFDFCESSKEMVPILTNCGFLLFKTRLIKGFTT